MTTIINLWGAPGSGKSTMAAGLFYNLKIRHHNVELATEYAKDLVYANRHRDLEDQIYVFGKQQYRIERLATDCDVIVTDSPVLMCLTYAHDYPECFRDTVAWRFSKYNNINILITRDAPYSNIGRYQTEQEANQKQQEIICLMQEFNVPFIEVKGNGEGLDYLLEYLSEKI